MARYEYACTRCQKKFEVEKPISDSKRPENCECGQRGERIMSTVLFSVNGYNASNGYSKKEN